MKETCEIFKVTPKRKGYSIPSTLNMQKIAILCFPNQVQSHKQQGQCSICSDLNIYLFLSILPFTTRFSFFFLFLSKERHKQIKRKEHTTNIQRKTLPSIWEMSFFFVRVYVNTAPKMYSFLEILFCWQRSHKSCLLICPSTDFCVYQFSIKAYTILPIYLIQAKTNCLY